MAVTSLSAERISPQQARMNMMDDALLVCAYDDEEKCRRNRLAGAISLGEFESQLDSLSEDQAIIFYCA